MVKSELIKRDFKTRPQFIVTLNILSEQFKCSEGYEPKFNKKTGINPNCFESRFSRDISSFLDTFFTRFLTPKEKKAKEEEKKARKKQNELIEYILYTHYKARKKF